MRKIRRSGPIPLTKDKPDLKSFFLNQTGDKVPWSSAIRGVVFVLQAPEKQH